MDQRIGLARRLAVTMVVALGMGLLVALLAFMLDPIANETLQITPTIWAQGALAGLGGLVLAAFFGRTGAFGWVLAVLVGAVITVFAGFLAPQLSDAETLEAAAAALEALGRDTSVLEIQDLALPMAVLASPFLGLLWIALVSAVHAAAGALRDP